MVTINGNNLGTVVSVAFGASTPRASIVHVSATQIKATAPAQAPGIGRHHGVRRDQHLADITG